MKYQILLILNQKRTPDDGGNFKEHKMNFFKISFVILIMAVLFAGCKKDAAKTTKPVDAKDVAQKASYVFGHDIGKKIKADGSGLDPEIFVQGLKDGYADKNSKYNETETQKIVNDFQTAMAENKKKEAEKNLADGKAFLEKNKTNKDVITLTSGLQYKVIKTGKGAKPTAEDTVKARYLGKLISGKKFDSSPENGDTVELPVGRVIKAWQEALTLMTVGSKWELFVPSDLGYGEYGSQGAIPPNSALIFEVELVDIVKTPKTDNAPKINNTPKLK
jgi:FKBP-type peptidyl-prolyl cis-trans isomerase